MAKSSEQLDLTCSECAENVRPRVAGQIRYRTVKGKRIRVSKCCGAPLVRDLESKKFVNRVKKIIGAFAQVDDETLNDMRMLRVPLRLFSKRDLIRLIYWITERQLRDSNPVSAQYEILRAVGAAGTKLPDHPASCRGSTEADG